MAISFGCWSFFSHTEMTRKDGRPGALLAVMCCACSLPPLLAPPQQMSQGGQDSHPLVRRGGLLYVNKGLPVYLALERKPDNSVGEIQNLADVALGIASKLGSPQRRRRQSPQPLPQTTMMPMTTKAGRGHWYSLS